MDKFRTGQCRCPLRGHSQSSAGQECIWLAPTEVQRFHSDPSINPPHEAQSGWVVGRVARERNPAYVYMLHSQRNTHILKDSFGVTVHFCHMSIEVYKVWRIQLASRFILVTCLTIGLQSAAMFSEVRRPAAGGLAVVGV